MGLIAGLSSGRISSQVREKGRSYLVAIGKSLADLAVRCPRSLAVNSYQPTLATLIDSTVLKIVALSEQGVLSLYPSAYEIICLFTYLSIFTQATNWHGWVMARVLVLLEYGYYCIECKSSQEYFY